MIKHYLKVAFRNLVKVQDTEPCQYHWISCWFPLVLRCLSYGFVMK